MDDVIPKLGSKNEVDFGAAIRKTVSSGIKIAANDLAGVLGKTMTSRKAKTTMKMCGFKLGRCRRCSMD
jgi:hypothetical protein